MERRRQDVRDQMKELSSNSKPVLLMNPEETVEEEARQRRAAEREVRTNYFKYTNVESESNFTVEYLPSKYLTLKTHNDCREDGEEGYNIEKLPKLL